MGALFFWLSLRYSVSMKVIDKYYGDNDDYFVLEGEDGGHAVRILTSSDAASAQGGVYIDDNSTYGEWGFPRLALEATVAEHPGSVLMLGGGPMRLAVDLYQALDQLTMLTVEQEMAVIGAAQQHFGFDRDAYTKRGGMIYIGDAQYALAGILGSRGTVPDWRPFDVVIVDLFNGSYWPSFMEGMEFWQQVHDVARGTVLVNQNELGKQSLPDDIETLFSVEERKMGNNRGSGMWLLTKHKRSE